MWRVGIIRLGVCVGGVGCGLYTGVWGEVGWLVVVADCSIVVVCTHGVCVVRVRFPAVRLGAWVFAEVYFC